VGVLVLGADLLVRRADDEDLPLAQLLYARASHSLST
jgi:hypothetical protein